MTRPAPGYGTPAAGSNAPAWSNPAAARDCVRGDG